MNLMAYVVLLVSTIVSGDPVYNSNNRVHNNRYFYHRRCYYRGKSLPCSYVRRLRNMNKQHLTTPTPYSYHHHNRYPKYGHYKPTTTVDPIIAQSQLVRERYIAARNVSSGNLFAFTQVDSNNFTSRIFDEVIQPNPQTCVRQLPRFADCKFQEIAYILANTPCVNSTNASLATTPSTNMDNSDVARSRKRRNLAGAIINNPDGSVTTVMRCEEKRATTRNNNLLLCSQCFAVTTLGDDRFPSFINEVICQPSDRLCLTSTGSCIENTITLTFLRDDNNVGPERLAEWREYPQTIRSACACQMFQGSALSGFV